MEEENIFKKIEADKTLPASKKKELLAELSTIQIASNIVEMYIGNYFNTLLASFTNIKQEENK